MSNKNQSQKICALNDIPDGGSTLINAQIENKDYNLIAVRKGSRVFLYNNSCPHIGAPLDFKPGQFLNLEKTHILCANHGALFDIETGRCIAGPCADDHLDSIESSVENGFVYITR